MPIGIPLRRQQVSTRCADEIADVVRRRYFEHRPQLELSAQRARFVIQGAQAGALKVDLLRYTGMTYGADTEPVQTLTSAVIQSGTCTIAAGGEEQRLGPGSALLYRTDIGNRVHVSEGSMLAVQIPQAWTMRCAEESGGDLSRALQFHSVVPISLHMQQIWIAAVRWASQTLASEGMSVNPLLLDGLRRTITGVLLATFPNTTMTDSFTVRPQGTSRTVCIAMDYIDANAHTALTLSDIAAACDVTPRGLHAAFRRHTDTTPMAYLRLARLRYVHRDLEAADPETTAYGDIAHRWGFHNTSRFVRTYLSVFGHHPATTLGAK